MDKFLKFFEFIVKNGPWALIVLIMLTWLAADYGFIQSRSKIIVETLAGHMKQSEDTQKILKDIGDVLEEQRRIQSMTGMLACLKEAKDEYSRTDCVKKFSNYVILKRAVP